MMTSAFAFGLVVFAFTLEIAVILCITKSLFFWPARQSQFFFELTKRRLLKEKVVTKIAAQHQAESPPAINWVNSLKKWFIEEGGDLASMSLLHLPVAFLFIGFYVADNPEYWLYSKLVLPYALFALVMLLGALALVLLSESYALMNSHINFFLFLNAAQPITHANKDANLEVQPPQSKSIGVGVNHV